MLAGSASAPKLRPFMDTAVNAQMVVAISEIHVALDDQERMPTGLRTNECGELGSLLARHARCRLVENGQCRSSPEHHLHLEPLSSMAEPDRRLNRLTDVDAALDASGDLLFSGRTRDGHPKESPAKRDRLMGADAGTRTPEPSITRYSRWPPPSPRLSKIVTPRPPPCATRVPICLSPEALRGALRSLQLVGRLTAR